MISSTAVFQELMSQLNKGQSTVGPNSRMLQQARELFLTQLNPGDVLEGIVTKQESGRLLLQLKMGLSLPIDLEGQVELGKLLAFSVQAKEQGKCILKPLGQSQTELPVVEKTLQELKLPNQLKMQDLISDFMQKQLPLSKEVLLKAYGLAKHFELPTKVLANFAEVGQIPVEGKGEALAQLKSGGLKEMVDTFKTLLDGVKEPLVLKEIFEVLGTSESPENLGKLLEDFQKQTQSSKGLSIPSEVGEQALSAKGGERATVSLEGSEESRTLSQGLLAETRQEGKEVLSDKEFLSKVSQWVEKDPTLLKKAISSLFEKNISFQMEGSEEIKKEAPKLAETYEVLGKLAKTLEKASLSQGDKELLQSMKPPLEVLRQANVEGQYYLFPITTPEKQVQGEVYFFKPKKGKSKKSQSLYIVLALDFPHLHNIEIHIQKEEKSLLLQLKVEEKAVKDHLTAYLPQLQKIIEEEGFTVQGILWGNLKEEKLQEEIPREYDFYHMDYKV